MADPSHAFSLFLQFLLFRLLYSSIYPDSYLPSHSIVLLHFLLIIIASIIPVFGHYIKVIYLSASKAKTDNFINAIFIRCPQEWCQIDTKTPPRTQVACYSRGANPVSYQYIKPSQCPT